MDWSNTMHELSATTSVRFLFCALLTGAVLFTATTVSAQGNDNPTQPPGDDNVEPPGTSLSTNGIFGCRGQGAAVANVGTTRAIGGVYVPVNDAAVTLNTGYLVYKECVLDGMARNIAQNATAEQMQQQWRSVNAQMNQPGGVMQNFDQFTEPYKQQILANRARAIQNGPMCGAFKNGVATALVRGRYTNRGSGVAQACAIPEATRTGMINRTTPVDWSTFVGYSTDNAVDRYETAWEETNTVEVHLEEDMRDQIMMGRGIIPIYEANSDPLSMRVVTPGFLIADSLAQSAGSGFRQLESANEIDQIVSNLFAGLTTRLITSGSGVPGLFTTTGTQPAYIDRMVSETQAMVRAGAVNAAMAVLAGARQTEAAYFAAKQGIASALIGAVTQLRGIENQCWNLIIPAVRTYSEANGNPTLVIATSTQFSQGIVDAQIRDVASTTEVEVRASQQALARIDQLIAQVSNSASSAAQQQALLELDRMIANNELHSVQDAQNAASQRDSVTSALATLVNDTRVAWADSTDPNLGWCNVNNTAVVQRWFNEWRR